MQVKNLNLIWNLILNGGNIFQKHVKAFLGQTKHTCESDPSCGQLFCNFFCVHELFRGSWFLIQYLSPSMNLSFVGYHSCGVVLWTVFRVHMDLVQHLHLSLGQSGKFQERGGSFWGAGGARQCQGTWRRCYCTLKHHWLRGKISEFSHHPCDHPNCPGTSYFSGSVSYFIKWEVVLHDVLWFLSQSLLLTLNPTLIGLPSPCTLCPFLQWASANPRKSLCRASLGHVAPSCHFRDLSACNIFLFTLPANYSPTLHKFMLTSDQVYSLVTCTFPSEYSL